MAFEYTNGLTRKVVTKATARLLAGLLASSFSAFDIQAQSPATRPAKSVKAGAHSPYQPNHFTRRALAYYDAVWGLDSLSVKAVESGALIRFSYRVIDPQKASILNDKKVEAFLDSPAQMVRLSIPSLEKVGQLRQGTTQQPDKVYWMAFSNPRRTVKRGDHVNVVVGKFHADGLVVE